MRALRACTLDDAGLAEEARDHVLGWLSGYNRSSVPPTKAQLGALAEALDRAAPGLPEQAVRELRFTLRTAAQYAH